jgi:REP element-mobilizing transposase RayT
MPRRYLTFSPGEYYHLYNRGVNREKIFFEPDNYRFFLERLERYLLPIMELYAYCLMPNHYHLLVSVIDPETSEVFKTSEVSRAMMKLSVSYTKAINKRYDRVGPLFQGAFQARHIDTSIYLWQLAAYLHQNPVEAGLVDRPQDWSYSSCWAYDLESVSDPAAINLEGRTCRSRI